MATKAEKSKRAATIVGALSVVLLLLISTAAVASFKENLTEALDSNGEPVSGLLLGMDDPAHLHPVQKPVLAQRLCGPTVFDLLSNVGHGAISVGDGSGMTFDQDAALIPCGSSNSKDIVIRLPMTWGQLVQSGADAFSIAWGDDFAGVGTLKYNFGSMLTGEGGPDPDLGASCVSVGQSPTNLFLLTEGVTHNHSLTINEVVFAGSNPDFPVCISLIGDTALFTLAPFPPQFTSFEVDFNIFGTDPNATVMTADFFDLFLPTTFLAGLAWLMALGSIVAAWWISPVTTFAPPRRSKQ